jgi:hypothetical protein
MIPPPPRRSDIMATPHLTAVPSDAAEPATPAGEVFDFARTIEAGAQRIRRLQQEARMLAREQVEALAQDLNNLAARAAEIASGGDVYPVGVRELASRMAEDLPQKVQVLMTIMERTAHG